jgi:hypothetical protein
VIAASILPALVATRASEVTLAIVCLFAMQIQIVRIPAILVLISTVLDVLTSYLIKSQVGAFWNVTSWLPIVGQIIDIVGELLSIVGVAWLVVIVVRHRTNSDDNNNPNPAPQLGMHK